MKDQPKQFGVWDASESVAVASLEEDLIILPVLVLLRSEGRCTRDTDACNRQIGGVLLQQRKDGSNRSVGYWYWTLIDIKQKLAITDRKYLATEWTVLLLRP